MNLNDVNFIFLIISLLFILFFLNFNNLFNILIISELFWILLYLASVMVAFAYDDVTILSLSFYFLILSAVEISVGLMLILLNKYINNTVNLPSTNSNFLKSKLNRFVFNKKFN